MTKVSFFGVHRGFSRTIRRYVQDVNDLNVRTPTPIKKLRSLLGLCEYYRRFIFQFAHVVLLLRRQSSETSLAVYTCFKSFLISRSDSIYY